LIALANAPTWFQALPKPLPDRQPIDQPRIPRQLEESRILFGYRRDRCKDVLLQENGYLVLRFLAGDVGKRLDEILDGILRALSHRRTRQAIAAMQHRLPILGAD
jgi:hypothetical protein